MVKYLSFQNSSSFALIRYFLMYMARPPQCDTPLVLRIFVCSQSGNHPQEDVGNVTMILCGDLAKSGYQPER
jgi:hypothetical protein